MKTLNNKILICCRDFLPRRQTFLGRLAVSLLATASLVSTVPVPVSAGTGNCDYTQYQIDAVRSGISQDLAPISTPVLSWSQYTWSSGSTGIETPSLIVDGIVYTHAGNGLWAFSADSGQIVWQQAISGTTTLQTSTPAYGDGKIFIATSDGYIRAYEALDGASLWSLQISDAILQCPITYYDGYIYVGQGGTGGDSNSYFCLDTSGNLIWIYTDDTSGYLWNGAAITGDYIVFGNHDGNLTCLNRLSGSFVDSWDLSALVDAPGYIRASVTYQNGFIYTTSESGLNSGYIWKIGFDTGTGKFDASSGWYNPIGFSTSTPVVYNGRVYAGEGEHGQDGSLVCLDDSSGEILWSYAVEGGVKSSPLLSIRDDNTYIYFNISMDDGYLGCLKEDGTLAWTWNPPDDEAYILQGVSLADGQIYLGTCSGYLYCLKEDNAWPQFQRDAGHSGVTSSTAPITAPVLDWSVFTHYTSTHGIDVVPAAADGKVFVIDVDGYAWAFDATSGETLWSVELEDDTRYSLASPVWADGQVFFATDKGYIYSLEADTGEILWSGKLTSGSSQNAELNTQIVYADGCLYIGSWEGQYYCLDAEGLDGEPAINWNYAVADKKYDWYSAASIIGDYCLFSDTDGLITCLNKTSGEFVSSLDLNDAFDISSGSIRSGISCNADQTCLYLTSKNGHLFSVGFDTATGAFNTTGDWCYSIDSYSTSTPVYYDGRVYVCSGGSFAGQEGGVYCLEATGDLLWYNDIAGETYGSQASPAISLQNGEMYIYITTGEPQAAVICLDGDGNQLWEYIPPVTEYTLQGVAIYSGRLYFVNDAGYLYALGKRTAWDVNQDGSIDVKDMILVGNHFDETGDAGWLAEDVKADGSIDVLDLIMIGNHFGE